MAFLHIEHPITDLATWLSAFNSYAKIRQQAGVTGQTIRLPVDDELHVVVDLEFDTADQAHAFLHFLETQIWSVPENAPALAGTPVARVLESVQLR